MGEFINGMFVQTVSDLGRLERLDEQVALLNTIDGIKREIDALEAAHPELDICIARENASDFPEDSKEFWTCIVCEFLQRLDEKVNA